MNAAEQKERDDDSAERGRRNDHGDRENFGVTVFFEEREIRLSFGDPVVEGRKILRESELESPDEFVLVELQRPGTRSIGLDEEVDLREPGRENFRAFRSDRLFTFTVDQRGYEWGAATINSFAGQVCISTAAMLMARTGHQVFVDTPDAHLVGSQPPLAGTWFHQALTDVGERLIEGVPILIGSPPASDIVFYLGGDLPWVSSPAARSVMIGASDWAAQVGEWPQTQSWSAQNWAFGAMAAAVLMAAEATKVSARALMQYSQYAEGLRPQFRDSAKAKLELAPASTPLSYDIGELDLISAGAVSNGLLYALLRVPGIAGTIRTFDEDVSEGPNLNRNMLLTREWLDQKKVALFHSFQTPLLNMLSVGLT